MEAVAWLARTHAAVHVGASRGRRRSGVPTLRRERERERERDFER
jgi:hypothetical protein